MLERLQRDDFNGQIYRYAFAREIEKVALRRGLDPEEVANLVATLGPEFALEFLNGPFEQLGLDNLPPYGSPTRFSDGTFAVFYASETSDTSRAEVKYHREQVAVKDPARRMALTLCLFHCQLSAKVVDLRPMKEKAEWTTLRSDVTEDPTCQSIGS